VSGQLQRLVLDFRDEVLLVRCLYDQADPAIPGPNTKVRTREVTEIARSGLRSALEALEDGAECGGTSGFTRREDILATASPDAEKQVKGAT
jgi:hypothetical protein